MCPSLTGTGPPIRSPSIRSTSVAAARRRTSPSATEPIRRSASKPPRPRFRAASTSPQDNRGPRTMTKGSTLLVAALENEGVDRIYGIPGEENLDVVEAIRRSSIELVLTRHEQAAAFMAATYGRLTGKPGVCISTLGPGALNLTTGAAYALLGAMPMIMITGQKGILSSRQARFQMVNTVATMQPLTKMSRQIVSPSMIPSL